MHCSEKAQSRRIVRAALPPQPWRARRPDALDLRGVAGAP